MTKTPSPKIDLYQTVTDRMVELLESGTSPWRKPWTGSANAPRNYEGKPYRGINVFILGAAGYESPFWMTYNQAKTRGGSVIKGEKSTLIVFWKMLRVEDKETGKTKTIPMLNYFRVFNLAQTKDVKPTKAMREWAEAREAGAVQHDPIEAAEAIAAGYVDGPKVYDASEAYYLPGTDTIHVPPMDRYARVEDYYGTLFHEMAHSTGHKSRLDRFEAGAFGSHAYGREELVAEMTAAFLAAEAGIEVTMEQSAAYLASWVKTIKADPRAVIVAAGAAQRAADRITGRTAAAAAPADAAEGDATDAVTLAA